MTAAANRFGPSVLGKAVAAYRRAVSLYPNSANIGPRLAEALLAVGDMAAFRREARTALQLDRETPHLDKKLPDDVRNRLMRSLGSGAVILSAAKNLACQPLPPGIARFCGSC